MWVASEFNGGRIFASAPTLVELHEELNKLDLNEVELALMWTGTEPPPDFDSLEIN